MKEGRSEPLRVAYLGASGRLASHYHPIVSALPGLEAVGLWSRSISSARRAAQGLGVPPYDDLDQLIREQSPDLAIVCVHSSANGVVGRQAAEAGLHLLLETPVALDLDEGAAILGASAARGLKVEVAEQFHLRPMEQIKLACLSRGLFGEVSLSICDQEGHGYHGVSVIRSYVGFDARALRVSARKRMRPLRSSRADQTEEQLEHALIEFEGGAMGVYQWSSVAYDSPLRGSLGTRFYAECGSWESIRLSWDMETNNPALLHLVRIAGVQAQTSEALRVERLFDEDRPGVLRGVRATPASDSIDPVEWVNPAFDAQRATGAAWDDDVIGVAQCVMSLERAIREDAEPRYGGRQGWIDQAVCEALYRSADHAGDTTEVREPPS